MKGLPYSKYNSQILNKVASLKEAGLRSIISLRDSGYYLSHAGIYLDYSNNYIDEELTDYLIFLAEEANLKSQIEKLFSGGVVNTTEDKPALHVQCRYSKACNGIGVVDSTAFERMCSIEEEITTGLRLGYTNKKFRKIVSIGIGGSYLGPSFVHEALSDYKVNDLSVSFLVNNDYDEVSDLLKSCNPEDTLFIVVSKSFSTVETISNADICKRWLVDAGCPSSSIQKHFMAVTSNPKAASEFGIKEKDCLVFDGNIGGRFSIWSAVGLPVMLSIGKDNFLTMKKGAAQMDEHFYTKPFRENIPVQLALLGILYRNYYDASCQAVIPYSYRLRRFPAFLQQLEMESNGKSVDKSSQSILYKTAPVVWGGEGMSGQHSYFQQLHQGSDVNPIDFIVPLFLSDGITKNLSQVSNVLAQTEALVEGQYLRPNSTDLNVHKSMDGNRPSTIFFLDRVSPCTLGALVALYEHKVFCQGVIWRCNSFDQFGVELGKEIAQSVLSSFESNTFSAISNSSTTRLIKRVKKFFGEE